MNPSVSWDLAKRGFHSSGMEGNRANISPDKNSENSSGGLLREALALLENKREQGKARKAATHKLAELMQHFPGSREAYAAEIALDALNRTWPRSIRETIIAKGVIAFALRELQDT